MQFALPIRSSLVALTLAGVSTALGQAPGDIRVEVAHGNNTDLSITPVWFGLHNGDFDQFNVGEAASSPLGTNAVELVAELGDVSQLSADFTAAPTVPGDFQGVVFGDGNGVPPIEPGETGVAYVTPANTAAYPYFSFLSMVVPTNDTFIGNDDPLALELFNSSGELIDEDGNPTASRTILVLGSDVFDAGTEVNGGPGAAFADGVDGTLGTDENGVVTLGSDLSFYDGVTDVTGRVINDLIDPAEVFATITVSIVPEPTTLGLLGAAFGVLGAVRRR